MSKRCKMCGRYTLRATAEELQAVFDFLRDDDGKWVPRYNMAPSQRNPVIRSADGKRHGKALRWGLVPPWAKDQKVGFKMINARSEEIAKSYKAPLKKRRCLVMTDGWNEWRDKQPYHFRLPDNELFAFAGIWESWKNPEDQSIVESYSIFTTSSVGVASEYHDRMPVIIPPDAYDAWLDPAIDGNDLIEPLLKSWMGKIEVVTANPITGNVKNETPDCLPE